MPRKARIDAPGALNHIIFRGIEGRNIFRDNKDRNNFLDRLGAVLEATVTPCFAWALMPNHVHLLLKTGNAPLSHVMQRLLSGHGTYFNLRHRRHGKLFQNRYKSILCQEEVYFKELVRYIHLNPVRAKLVADLDSLDKWSYGGHSTIMGKQDNEWHDDKYVLKMFGGSLSGARKKYRDYIQKGMDQGRKPELTGWGLIRSLGGWSAVKMLRRTDIRMKSDERILGDGDFVERALQAAQERYERSYALSAQGYDLSKTALWVKEKTGIEMDELSSKSKRPAIVRARSLFCFVACRELGMKTTEMAVLLKISQPSVSKSVLRGEKICKENDWKLTPKESY
ncbi:MAG: transposase [Desulfofustis sp.]|jgi:REP element-mobilizing transposase RayT|nr:transposase [Desulfofustis sp.]